MGANKRNKVQFFFEGVAITLKERNRLKDFIETLFKREKKKLENLNYIFCSDKALLKINKDYLGHDFYTDIITFNLSTDHKAINGEIYISTERVKDNASLFNVPLSKELHRIIFHGALHLCGYTDGTKKQKLIMRKREDAYLELWESFT